MTGLGAIGVLFYEANRLTSPSSMECPEPPAWDSGEELLLCAAPPGEIRCLLDKYRHGDALPGETVMKLTALGSAAAPALVQAFRDPSDEVALVAIQAVALLGRQGSLGKEALHAAHNLGTLTRHPNNEIRFYAVLALGYLGRSRTLAVPELISALDDDEWSVRAAAARVLGKLGPEAREARPRLERLVADTNDFTREQAQLALRRIKTSLSTNSSAPP